MFELMRLNELTLPELTSETNSFCVTLRHNTIYTDQQRLWLDQFESYRLSREQKAIVVLGIDGNIIAPQDIWDSLGIVDTEHYRQLIRSLQDLGILGSEIRKEAAQKKARIRRIPVRKIPRFKINPKQQELPKQPSGQLSKEEDDAIRDSPDPRAKLWLGNLPYELEETALVEFLSPFAEVQNIYIPKDGATGTSKGYALAEFGSIKTAERVMPKLNGLSFGGRDIIVRRATPRGK